MEAGAKQEKKKKKIPGKFVQMKKDSSWHNGTVQGGL